MAIAASLLLGLSFSFPAKAYVTSTYFTDHGYLCHQQDPYTCSHFTASKIFTTTTHISGIRINGCGREATAQRAREGWLPILSSYGTTLGDVENQCFDEGLNFIGFATTTYPVNTYTTGTYNVYLTDLGQQDLNSNPVTQSQFWMVSNYLEIEYDTSSTNPLEGSHAYALGNVYMPTSTYDGTFSEYVPSVTFVGTSTYANHSYITGSIDSIAGAATSVLPMCIAYPFFSLLDGFLGGLGSNTNDIRVVAFGSTSTLSLSSASGTFQKVGLSRVWQSTMEFIVALGWLAFAVYVFKDLFAPEEGVSD